MAVGNQVGNRHAPGGVVLGRQTEQGGSVTAAYVITPIGYRQ